jgi:hypothetical protein
MANHLRLRKQQSGDRARHPFKDCGDVAEWSKALAWKVSIRQNRIEGSNPSVSASHPHNKSLFKGQRENAARLAANRRPNRIEVADQRLSDRDLGVSIHSCLCAKDNWFGLAGIPY